jgi:hypothetical protein
MVGIFNPACELLPPWMQELLVYCCPSTSLRPPPPLPKLNVQYIQTVCVWGGGGELCCRPYSAGGLHSVSDQIQNLPNCFTTPHKMTSEDDSKRLVSLKFIRPWLARYQFWGRDENLWRNVTTSIYVAGRIRPHQEQRPQAGECGRGRSSSWRSSSRFWTR